MVGWANYMRTPHPDAVRRRISAHLTYDMDGRVEQHVDFDFAAHTQGIKKSEYAYAASNWPLFRHTNPNLNCIGHEYEDGGKPFSHSRPMPTVQLEAIINAHKWTFDTIIRAEPVLYTTEISHDQLTRRRHQDPGDWVMNNIMDGLGATEAKTLSPDFDPSFFLPTIKKQAAPTAKSRAGLRQKILRGERKCTFNDAVYIGWIGGQEANQWSRRVWYTLRKYNHSPLAPWQDGIHLYDAICGTIMAESAGNPFAYNRNVSGWLPGGKRGPSADRGLVQINDRAWPDISDAEAYDPAFAINFIVKHFPSKPHWWHGFKAWKARR